LGVSIYLKGRQIYFIGNTCGVVVFAVFVYLCREVFVLLQIYLQIDSLFISFDYNLFPYLEYQGLISEEDAS
jgi:predicted permease